MKTDYYGDTFDNDGANGDDSGEVYEMIPADPANAAFALNTDDPKWLDALNPPDAATTINAMNGYYKDAYIYCEAVTSGNDHPWFSWVRNEGGSDVSVDVPNSSDYWVVVVGWSYDCVGREPHGPCSVHGQYITKAIMTLKMKAYRWRMGTFFLRSDYHGIFTVSYT
ncbi:MAG: hypothetical protein MZU97_18635 [Bacillus subtilis]|nr:hypothetical protein [Bacillus subtilis]